MGLEKTEVTQLMEKNIASQPTALPATTQIDTRQPIEGIALAQLASNSKSPVSSSALLSIIVILLISMLSILSYGLWRTASNVSYIHSIAMASDGKAMKEGVTPKLAVAIASYSASYESAMFNRLFALLLSYIIVFVGCIFVIGNQIAYYQLRLEHLQNKSALETSSPGLVLITLGCALVAVAIIVPKGATLSIGDDGNSLFEQHQPAAYGQQQQNSGYGQPQQPVMDATKKPS